MTCLLFVFSLSLSLLFSRSPFVSFGSFNLWRLHRCLCLLVFSLYAGFGSTKPSSITTAPSSSSSSSSSSSPYTTATKHSEPPFYVSLFFYSLSLSRSLSPIKYWLGELAPFLEVSMHAICLYDVKYWNVSQRRDGALLDDSDKLESIRFDFD